MTEIRALYELPWPKGIRYILDIKKLSDELKKFAKKLDDMHNDGIRLNFSDSYGNYTRVSLKENDTNLVNKYGLIEDTSTDDDMVGHGCCND